MSAARKVLVVGGKGRMGRWLVRVCQRLGDEVAVCDLDNQHLLSAAASDSEIVIVSVPPRAAAKIVGKVIGAMPKDGLVIDVTSLKISIAVAVSRANPSQNVALVHPMCGPPEDVSVGDAAVILTETWLEMSGQWRDWYERFLAAIGGRHFRMNALEHDRLDLLLQPGAHALLLALAVEMAASEHPLEDFERVSPPVAAGVLRALRLFLGGSEDIFAWLQVEAADQRNLPAARITGTMKKVADLAAAGQVAGLRQMFLDAKSKLLP